MKYRKKIKVNKIGQKSVDKNTPDKIQFSRLRLCGGDSNVRTKSNELRLLNRKGGGHHENTGGCD